MRKKTWQKRIECERGVGLGPCTGEAVGTVTLLGEGFGLHPTHATHWRDTTDNLLAKDPASHQSLRYTWIPFEHTIQAL